MTKKSETATSTKISANKAQTVYGATKIELETVVATGTLAEKSAGNSSSVRNVKKPTGGRSLNLSRTVLVSPDGKPSIEA